MSPGTRTKITRVGLVILGLAFLAAMFSIGRGTAPAGDNKVAKTEPAKPAEPAKKAPEVVVDPKIDALQKQIAEAKKANELLKKQLNEAKRAPKPVPQAQVPVVVAPESATTVLKAIGLKAQTEDSIVKVWTGRPAVIHELAETNAKKADAQKPAATAGSNTPKAEMTAEAKEQKTELEDRIAWLQKKIRNEDVYRRSMQSSLDRSPGEDPDVRKEWRDKVKTAEEKISAMKNQIAEAQAKLKGLR